MLRPFRSIVPTVHASAVVDVSVQVIGDEDRCLSGIGAILLNGCRIGTGSIVAAGTVVPEGMLVPPGSLVMGVPGTGRRPLTPEEDASLLRYAESYVRYRLDFQAEHSHV